ncbi:MAG: hypothetical protein IJ879_04890 [Muribaculaceae bacterium]|nr:hypothetical protein [Muribaculaceae bacterium]
MQAERRTKQKIIFFVFYPEAKPIFGAAKVVQAERRTKQKIIFFLPIVEAQPIFGN